MTDTSRDLIEIMIEAAPFADNEAGIPEMCAALRALLDERDALKTMLVVAEDHAMKVESLLEKCVSWDGQPSEIAARAAADMWERCAKVAKMEAYTIVRDYSTASPEECAEVAVMAADRIRALPLEEKNDG